MAALATHTPFRADHVRDDHARDEPGREDPAP
jgi:hypothetical protein